MTRRIIRTPEETRAFKAANLAANERSKAIAASAARKPARKPARRKSPGMGRRALLEQIREVEEMMRAARRQGLFEAVPALVSRHNALSVMASNQALSE